MKKGRREMSKREEKCRGRRKRGRKEEKGEGDKRGRRRKGKGGREEGGNGDGEAVSFSTRRKSEERQLPLGPTTPPGKDARHF